MATYVYNKKLGEWELETPSSVPISDLANIPTDTILGRTTAGTGPVEELTVSDTKTMLDIASVTSAVVAGKQDIITLTTTGTSGAATFSSSILNIPVYSSGGGGNGASSASRLYNFRTYRRSQ